METWIINIAKVLEKNEDPTFEHYNYFLQEPGLALQLISHIDSLDEKTVDENSSYFSACVFAFDVCVAQLQVLNESGHKMAQKVLNDVMSLLAKAITSYKHSLVFWLPILNAFYEVHVDLSTELKNAYLELAHSEETLDPVEESSHLNSIKELIIELADLGTFEIAENFFAQTYALPTEFFADLVLDLYSIAEGKEIALVMMMHPKREVRELITALFDQLLNQITISSTSLSRLNMIKNFYPTIYHDQFNTWIKDQRRKGVTFSHPPLSTIVKIKASEVDGTGAQGIFIHLKKNGKNRLCGMLFKEDAGIKDAWITPEISVKDINQYYQEAIDDCVYLREVDITYLLMMTNHFLAITVTRGNVPDLHFLEIQEELGLNFIPSPLNLNDLIEQIAIQISPFTPAAMEASFRRSNAWSRTKPFATTWYIESAEIDKIVNRRCNFIDNVKVCQVEDATKDIFTVLENQREQWLFHFLWIALWIKSKTRKNEKAWMDSFFIAYAIHKEFTLESIPIMHQICQQTIVNSLETMEDRRTHLNIQ